MEMERTKRVQGVSKGALSEAMLKKDGGNGLFKKPKLDSSSEIVLEAYAIREIVT